MNANASGPVGELPSWPALFTPPAELLGWLEEQARQHQHDQAVLRHLRALRWLVLVELDRTAPEPPPKPALLKGLD